MKNYDLIIIGSGSAMNLVEPMIDAKPDISIAVIDKDEPGGICLTRGCIPSKLLLYPAELIREIESAWKFGIDIEIKHIDFKKVMERMRTRIYEDIDSIRIGLSKNKNIDYYPEVAEFTAPYTLKVADETITSKMIFLCTGSKTAIPPVKGLNKVKYLTSDTVLKMTSLPGSIAIIGGSYIAAEYGHFFSAMGSEVTIIGRNPQFIPEEEPEVSALAGRVMSQHLNLMTNCEATEVRMSNRAGKMEVIAKDRSSGREVIVEADEILVAAGRGPNSDILHPEKGEIKTSSAGWIEVNEYLETSKPGIWAFGDANGKYLFKHVANYESTIVYYNAVLHKNIKADYHAVPHAVFSYPEIAGVGLREKEAIEIYGADGILIGHQRYEDTAKGHAMEVKDYFVKVIVESETDRILGAHIIGPYASILIHEIIPLMYTPDQSSNPIKYGMDIHPSLSEVVSRAFFSLMPPGNYHHIIEHFG